MIFVLNSKSKLEEFPNTCTAPDMLEDLRRKLTMKVLEYVQLTHPDVVSLSQELDVLIVRVQRQRLAETKKSEQNLL